MRVGIQRGIPKHSSKEFFIPLYEQNFAWRDEKFKTLGITRISTSLFVLTKENNEKTNILA